MGEIIQSIFCDHKLQAHGKKWKSSTRNGLKLVISNSLENTEHVWSLYQTYKSYESCGSKNEGKWQKWEMKEIDQRKTQSMLEKERQMKSNENRKKEYRKPKINVQRQWSMKIIKKLISPQFFFSVKGEKNVENFLCNYENKSEHLKITD